jgi:hypothetical protein
MQNDHLIQNHNLHKALSWLAVDNVKVIAFKYVPESESQPVILIDPVINLSDGQEMNGCILRFRK